MLLKIIGRTSIDRKIRVGNLASYQGFIGSINMWPINLIERMKSRLDIYEHCYICQTYDKDLQ